jgi:LysR family transcriptional regulator of gallate degradation
MLVDDIYQLNLRHLDALLVTGQSGSMSSAARAVNLSQPALTQALAKVERVLGERLFDRQPGGASATAAGRVMMVRVDRALHYLARGGRLVRRSARLPPLVHIERRVTMVQLRALIAVEGHSSYVQASELTGLSQPAVHRAVRELQDILGMDLFVRVGRIVRPTDVASRFVRFARLMFSELRAGVEEIRAMGTDDAGRVTVGILPSARATFFSELLARFTTAHVSAAVKVVEAPYQELLSSLLPGDIDLLIGARRDPSPHKDAVQNDLFDDDPVVVGRSDHPLHRKTTLALDDLLRFPWVISARGIPLRKKWEGIFVSRGVEPPKLRIECGSVLVTRGLLLQGDWLTLISRDQFLFERRAGTLTEIGDLGTELRRRIALTHRRDWMPTTLQADFVTRTHALARERDDVIP